MGFQSKKNKKRKKLSRARLIKGVNGTISILLCLIIAPFITVTLALVEYARYQEVFEIADEIYELTGLSSLSDYDTYIHNRFGFLATTQESTLGADASDLLTENAKLLGSQISVTNVTASGSLALSNEDVLKRQVVDFSELTATTAVLAEDFNLEDLINKLQNVSVFTDTMNTLDGMADFANAVSDAVDALDKLQTAVGSLISSVENATGNAGTLAQDAADLITKLADEGITISGGESEDSVSDKINNFCENYLEDFKGLYSEGKALLDEVENIKNNLDSLKTNAKSFIDSVKKAKTAAESLNTKNSADEDGSISKAAQSTMEDILQDLSDLAESTISDIKDETITAAKNALLKIAETTMEDIGLKGFADRYEEIVNGSYFDTPLSETAEQDLKDLLKTVGELYNAQNPSDVTEGLVSFFKGKLIPDITIDVASISSKIDDVLSKALSELEDKITDKVTSLLTELVNVIKGLFDLDLFYEPDMNAFVSTGSAQSSSPYQEFLNAIGDLFTHIDDFTSSLSEEGFFNKLFGAVTAIANMFVDMFNVMKAIVDVVGSKIESIIELGSSIVKAEGRSLYENLLISGYMRHNLPCRLNSGEWEAEDGGTGAVQVKLTGRGLTGFQYNNIARPAAYTGKSAEDGGFQDLANTIENLKNGSGSDTMFKGAELEYIYAGTNSEIANQIIVFFEIYFLRMIIDLPSIFINEEVSSIAGAANIASWVVYILYIVIEPFCDTLLLVNGGEIPLIRTDCWLTASKIDDFINKLEGVTLGSELRDYINNNSSGGSGGSSSGESGNDSDSSFGEIGYQTHVLILLVIFVSSDTQITRLKDLIELETKEHYSQNVEGISFEIGKAYTAVTLSADVSFSPLIDFDTLTGKTLSLPSTKIQRTVSY